MKAVEQKYKSAKTSVNGHKLPAIGRIWDGIEADGLTLLDYGCGKFDNTKQYLEEKGFKYYGYDPFNRSAQENGEAMANFRYDRAILSNVLNVIAERTVRLQILCDIKFHLCQGGILYIKIYEGNGSGVMKINEKKNSYQLNLKTSEYLPEVRAVFDENNCVWLEWINGVHVIVARKRR